MPSLPNRQPILPPELEPIEDLYREVYTIVSPPRCSSTALARVFWEHPSIAAYSHEPFEIAYYRDASLDEVAQKLEEPLDLEEIAGEATAADPQALLIKEMPYQVGPCFPHLAALTTAPIVFLLRDPRLSIASRMDKKRQVGDSPIFPLRETGWELLHEQVAWCDRHGVPYVIVRTDDFRDRPLGVLPELFARLGLEFSDTMLSWQGHDDLEIDNLGGDHSHLYRRVLSSTGLNPEVDELPEVHDFPADGGFRDHLPVCLDIYRELSRSPRRIVPLFEVN